MDYSEFFARQLTSTADGFVWATGQLPDVRQRIAPPIPQWLGTWDLPRHIFHMVTYEREIALPSMRQWLGGPRVDESQFDDEDALWAQRGVALPIQHLIEQFHAVRAEQITLLPGYTAEDWVATRETIWGTKPLHWVVSKTFQHTAEHTHDVMRLALFWDTALERQRQAATHAAE